MWCLQKGLDQAPPPATPAVDCSRQPLPDEALGFGNISAKLVTDGICKNKQQFIRGSF